MDDFSSAEEETPPPPTDDDAPTVSDDPAEGITPWELTEHERHIYEAGFMAGYFIRGPEVAQLDHEADRLYRAAFDHRHCACWKGHRGITSRHSTPDTGGGTHGTPPAAQDQ